MNTIRKGQFTTGNRASVGKGRPKKNNHIKSLEQLRDEVCQMPDTLLKAIAQREPVTLKQFQIPVQQVKQLHQVLASGLLFLRGNA